MSSNASVKNSGMQSLGNARDCIARVCHLPSSSRIRDAIRVTA
ncbi:MAG: hypothetical protein QOD24_4420 [Solirubrobacteraceae bacterium]|jgi:hypothetical protein|nr:hypothetical protein [Solirubrobacteraceae bacterium]